MRAALYTSLLVHVGCTGYAHEAAHAVNDELVWTMAAERANIADPKDVFATFLPMVLRGRSVREQVRLALFTMARGRRFGMAYSTAACEVGRDAARRLGLPEAVQHGVYQAHEWWNGKGVPDGAAGGEISVAARLAVISTTAALFDTIGGAQAAVDVVRQRRGGLLDPAPLAVNANLATSPAVTLLSLSPAAVASRFVDRQVPRLSCHRQSDACHVGVAPWLLA